MDGIGARSTSGDLELAVDPLDRAVLYQGIGQGDLGVRGRRHDEHGWIGPEAAHGHGIAMFARHAAVVVGTIEVHETDLSWLPQVVREDGAEIVQAWLKECRLSAKTALEASERIAIRLGIHIGDTGAPVQSQFAGAWNTQAPQDWATYAAAACLRIIEAGQPTVDVQGADAVDVGAVRGAGVGCAGSEGESSRRRPTG